jgi:hypothetical protein
VIRQRLRWVARCGILRVVAVFFKLFRLIPWEFSPFLEFVVSIKGLKKTIGEVCKTVYTSSILVVASTFNH